MSTLKISFKKSLDKSTDVPRYRNGLTKNLCNNSLLFNRSKSTEKSTKPKNIEKSMKPRY